MKRTEFCGHNRNGWIAASGLLGKGIGLLFTDRSGGCSPFPYNTLNLAYHTGDDPRNVRDNREKVAGEMNISPERFVYLNQVHGLKVERAGGHDLGDPANPPRETFLKSDGLFTTEAMVVLSVLTADCLPLALAETKKNVVAILHAGWQGTIMDIAGAALCRLWEELLVRPDGIRVVMGPGIGPCCYVVDEGRAGMFVEEYGMASGVVLEGNGYRLDLYQANRVNLLKAGIKEDNISMVGGCTCCDRSYFSFRREGKTGRQGAFIYLKD